MNNLSELAQFIFNNYIKSMSSNLIGSINLYFYYIGFFIESINSFKLILYFFLKLTDAFEQFEYKDFCPNLKSTNCLNLIILLFKSIASESLETLVVYALLIFKYEYIFRDIEENIKDSILEKSVKETAKIVEKKTLKNTIIFQYIFDQFLKNLNNNIIYPNLPRFNEIIINEKKEDCDKKLMNDVKKENNIQNERTLNEKENKIINEEENNHTKNDKKDNSLSEKNIINELVYNENNNKTEENLNIINDKEEDNSTNVDNDDNNNGTKEYNLSNEIINKENSENNNSNKKDNININDMKNYSLILTNEGNQLEQIQLLINEINKLKSRDYEREEQYKEMIKQSNEREEKYKELIKQNNEREKQYKKLVRQSNEREEHYKELDERYEELKSELEELKKEMGYIQMRDRAKNLLKPYQNHLNNEDNEMIVKDKNKKWELIANRIKEYYKKFENSQNYKAFIEIVDKSVKTISKGNYTAYNINYNYYEKDIEKIIKENKFIIMNTAKLCFLLQINVSKDLLLKGYELLDKYYESNMTRAFNRGSSLEDFFQD